jgi:transposase
VPHFVGLDVSVKDTAIRVVDERGRVAARATVENGPAAIVAWLLGLGLRFGRIGLEAGPRSPRLYAGPGGGGAARGCVETRHMHAGLPARINKMVCPGRPPAVEDRLRGRQSFVWI